jgi:hypothetical protein
MLQSMDEAAERQILKFSYQTVVFAVETMKQEGKTHLYYSNMVDGHRLYGPGVLWKHIGSVVEALQIRFKGEYVVSRTPGGIVIDKT